MSVLRGTSAKLPVRLMARANSSSQRDPSGTVNQQSRPANQGTDGNPSTELPVELKELGHMYRLKALVVAASLDYAVTAGRLSFKCEFQQVLIIVLIGQSAFDGQQSD